MNPNDPMEDLIKNLRYQSASDTRERILERAYGVMDEMENTRPVPHRLPIWRTTMGTLKGKVALAAAVILIVLGGITLWPFGGSGNEWWLGSPAAWGQEILETLGRMQAVVYRQRTGWDSPHGPPEMNVGWERRYNAKDCYRRDRYDDGVNIMNTQWVISDAQGLLMTEVSHEYECFFTQENEAYGFMAEFVEEMRRHVKRLDKADRPLEPQVFDGHKCVGFEISAARYGDNPKERFDRIWFDVETKLPMRIERHGIAMDFDPGRTMTIIHDQFEYFAEVPADLFVPRIPEGYVSAHPDEIRMAREQEAKGRMSYADVPAGLKDAIVTGLRAVETGSYREGSTIVSFSKTFWREDVYSSDGALLVNVKWYRLEGDLGDGPFEPQGHYTLTETVAELGKIELEVVTHPDSSFRSHPMSRIGFLSALIDEADTFFDHVQIDGIACYGFEVSAKKYGDNPDGMVHRIYLDAATNLPVRMEFEYIRDDGTPSEVRVKDQFQWNVEHPEGFFIPQIPADFITVNN